MKKLEFDDFIRYAAKAYLSVEDDEELEKALKLMEECPDDNAIYVWEPLEDHYNNSQLMEIIEAHAKQFEEVYNAGIQYHAEYLCPVCGGYDKSRDDYDSPETMNVCDQCGSEWIKDTGEITLNGREVE